MSFAKDVAGYLPLPLSLPAEFAGLYHWLDSQGHVRRYHNADKRYADLYPPELAGIGSSIVTFVIPDSEYSHSWTRGHREAANRLAPIIRTGGDGSHAALWLDEQGKQWFVHLGSGSGSTMLGILTDSPIDMLRLVAIGYDELCWPELFSLRPEDAREYADNEYIPPLAFRKYVEDTFGVEVPATASEIVSGVASMLDTSSDDPFWRWINGFNS